MNATSKGFYELSCKKGYLFLKYVEYRYKDTVKKDTVKKKGVK